MAEKLASIPNIDDQEIQELEELNNELQGKKAETASDHQVERSNNTSIGRHCKHPATPSAEERRANSSNIA